MVDEKYTRCPECQTVYRVTDEQLAARGGSVRCGQCNAVFDGHAELVMPELPELPEAKRFGRSFREAASAATAAIRGASSSIHKQAPEPDVAAPRTASGAEFAASPLAANGVPDDSSTPGSRRATAAAVDDSPSPPGRGEHNAMGLTVVVLGVLLLFQIGFQLREPIARTWPATRPTIVQLCKTLHCTVGTTRGVGDLEIASSGLHADPAHQGLLILTATLRNRGTTPLAFPYLELSLTDPQDQVVVRRALTPVEYAGGTVDIARGIPANSEIPIKLFIDASATNQAGYRLFLFYG